VLYSVNSDNVAGKWKTDVITRTFYMRRVVNQYN